jgi:hypothetical protein
MSKKCYVVECDYRQLSAEAIHWIENYSSDLAWITRRWRIWSEPAREDELTLDEYFNMVYSKHEPKIPLRRRQIDAVQFVSKRDALYFTLVLLDDSQGTSSL